MKEVALVGFYDPTLPAVANTTAQEIWVPNHGYMVMQEDLPRCTRLFEIHKQDWFRRKELPTHEAYWKWLQELHPFPIYMQEHIPEIKNCVVYPFKEVCEDLFPHLLRQDPTGKLIQEIYLTSTASFMLALAIHEKFERVWMYGIGMSTGTEYAYQLPGFTYMKGLANGRGIDTIEQWESPINKALVYAYDAIPMIFKERLIELRDHYYQKLVEANDKANELTEALNNGQSKDVEATYAASDLRYAWQGAVAMIDELLKQDSEYLSRQALEVKRRPFVTQADTFKANVNMSMGKFFSLPKNERKTQVGEKVWKKYLDERASMHANAGAVQLLDNLVRESDMIRVDHEIVCTIKDIGK